MSNKPDLHKHTLNLYAGDYEKLGELYPDLPVATIIRKLIRSYIEQIEAGDETSLNVGVNIKL